jgi:hypothetical protein
MSSLAPSANNRRPSKTMWSQVAALTLIALFGLNARAVSGAQGGKGRCPASQVVYQASICVIPVTTIFNNLDSNGLVPDIASDGLGSYSNNVSGVTTFLTSNGYNGIEFGDWQFGVYDSLTRNVSESLFAEDAVQPGDQHYTASATPPFWGTLVTKAHIEVKCTMVLNNMLTMAAGSSFTCPLVNRFNTPGNIDFTLSPAISFTHFPETTDVQVRCNTADVGGCNDWFIDPIGLSEAVARLVNVPQKHESQINHGDFYMRFHIHITRP